MSDSVRQGFSALPVTSRVLRKRGDSILLLLHLLCFCFIAQFLQHIKTSSASVFLALVCSSIPQTFKTGSEKAGSKHMGTHRCKEHLYPSPF